MKKLIIDLETTGTNQYKCGIVQIAGVIQSPGKPDEEFDIVVTPPETAEFQDGALATLGLTKEELLARGVDYPTAYGQLISILDRHVNRYEKTDKLFWYGYNARFDNDFLRQFFARNDDKFFGSWFWVPPIDVMTLAMEKLAPYRAQFANFQQSTVYGYLFGESFPAHDALEDVKATMAIYDELKTR